ncbi:hypothetical protein DYB32_002094 [Aphanomyces invadans]|uniref:D-xylose 1-dehydrogenase (NADP(+), D-xylono-1,5-lactone-forming) n=1 Tax=Aphanomyces invadans TaxID=157072 RepID=A0A3R6ZV23_9STRA|nr:hypothetical protein DYB32_002094 [Aphanomyces invadans]
MDIESSNGLASKAANALSPTRTRMGVLVVALILGVLFVVLVVSFAETDSIRVDPNLPPSVAALMNTNVLPCTDFYEYACGGWLANTSLPPDRSSYARSFTAIQDQNDVLIRSILDEKWPLVSELFDSCMNTTILDMLGAAPLRPDLDAIRATKTKDELLALIGALSMKSPTNFLFPAYIDVDEQRGQTMVLHVEQGPSGTHDVRSLLHGVVGGITLPDRDDYVNATRFAKLDVPYRSMITKLMTLAGWPEPKSAADVVVPFETKIAQAMVPKAALRNPQATYNPMSNISGTFPSMDRVFRGAKILLDDTTRVIVATPAFFQAAEALVTQTPLDDLQTVVAFQLVLATSGGLAASFRNATFDFFGKTLFGLQTMRPRHQQCTDKVNAHLGELMARYGFDHVGLLSGELLHGAYDYPVVLDRGDYFGNVQVLAQMDHMRAISLLNTTVDKTKWSMHAHAVNAYYNPTFNQIVFPAGILQPPFFDADADAAMNYGAIGMVIGYCSSLRRNFNGDGLLKPWWSNDTAAAFEDKAKCMVDQYAQMPVYGNDHTTLLGMVNGELTLGETIADVGGLAVAFQAYAVRMKKASLNGKTYVRIPTWYGSYDALCRDPQVDVVYVGTLHTHHHPHTMLALSHNKHVLVEKPMALNRRDAADMVSLAKAKGLFLMEAMWTRFFPAIQHVRSLLADGVIGDVHAVHADMGFAFPSSADRIWKRDLGGGGLLDIGTLTRLQRSPSSCSFFIDCQGIYPLAFVSMVFPDEAPINVHTVGSLSDDGVDVFAVVTLQYSRHRYGTIQYSCLADFREEVTILGSKGRLVIDAPAHTPTRVRLDRGSDVETVEFPLPTPAPSSSAFNFGGSVGLSYEAAAVGKAIRIDHATECAEYPLSESLFLAGLMDTIRRDLGVVYDADLTPSYL